MIKHRRLLRIFHKARAVLRAAGIAVSRLRQGRSPQPPLERGAKRSPQTPLKRGARSDRKIGWCQFVIVVSIASIVAGGIIPKIDGHIFRLTLRSAQAIESPIAQNQPDAQALLDRGRELYKSGQFSATVTVLQQAASAFQTQGDKLQQAIALSNLSLIYQQLGQWEKATQAIAFSLNLLGYPAEKRAEGAEEAEEAEGAGEEREPAESQQSTTNYQLPTTNYQLPAQNLKILAQTLEIQADLQLKLGQAAPALETWQQAASIYDRLDDKVAIARTLINQSLARQSLGFYRQALATLEQVSQTLEQQPDSLLKAIALRNLGDVLQLVGNLEQSMKVLQQSLDLAKRLKSPSEISAALLSLGNTERAWGNRVQMRQNMVNEDIYPSLRCNIGQLNEKLSQNAAISHYQRAERYYQAAAIASPLPASRIQAKVNQINILLELQQRAQIHKIWTNLQPELTNLSPSHATIFAQINLAQSLGCLKHATVNNALTWKEIAQIFATAIQQARSIGDVRSQAYALGALGGLYLESQDLPEDAQTLHKSSLQYAQELTTQALTLAQAIQANDIVYLWQWQSGYLLKLQGDLKGAIASYTEAVNTLQSLRSDLVALNPDIQFSFRNSVEPVYRQLVDLLLRSESGSWESGVGSRNSASRTTQIQQQNLQQARNAIEALQLTELENFFREACLQAKPRQIDEVVDKTDPTAAVVYPIILPDRLEVIVKLPNQTELRHYTTYRSRQEIEDSIEKLQLFLVEPDRINDIKELSQQVYDWLIQPFVTEFDRQKIKTLVFVLDGSLRNIPMAVLYDKQQKQYLIEKYAIALAPGLQLVDPQPLQRQRLKVLIAGISKERQIAGRNFSPLENVLLELQQIQNKVPNSEELLNQAFTKQNIQSQIDAAEFSVVHIATHGEFSSNAEETFILAWEQLIKVKDFDKLLQLSSQRQPKAIELLVLSACQTAAGDRQAALGLAGIAVRAGARSTLATLWSVDDRSTAELMTHFYQELENATVTKAEALRRAQLTLLKNYEIPYFWAAYVLVGNWL